MNHLQEIQETRNAIVNRSKPLAEVLMLCKLLAVKVKYRAFREWADLELKGYPDQSKIPEYRTVKNLPCYGNFEGLNWHTPPTNGFKISFSNFDEVTREGATTRYLSISAANLENLISEIRQSGKSTLDIDWPSDIVKTFACTLNDDKVATKIWTSIPVNCLINILEAIRGIALDFIIEIESGTFPAPYSVNILRDDWELHIGDRHYTPVTLNNPNQSKVVIEEDNKSAQITNNYINNFHGTNNIGNLANQVNDSARQEATQNIDQLAQQKTLAEMISEMEKLLKQLKEINPTATEAEQVAYINDVTSPELKQRAVEALQATEGKKVDTRKLVNKYVKIAEVVMKTWMLMGL
jgi:hypothetical protein